jgi:signal peptidase
MINEALSLLLGLVLVAIAATALPAVWGWHTYVVLSGSMAPTIPMGSLVVTRPVALGEVQLADVISFARRDAPDMVITHRVVAKLQRGSELQLSTQGDANNTADSWTVGAADRVERVQFHLPYLGYAVNAAARPQARALLIVGILLYLILQVLTGALSRAGARRRPVPAAPGVRSDE